jgi:hypothetical protein
MSRKPPEIPVGSCPLGEGRNPPTPHQHRARQHPRITQFFQPTRPHLQSLNAPAQPCQEVAAALLPHNNPLVSVCNTSATIEQAPPPPLARPVPVIGQRITQLQSHPAPRTPNAPHVPHLSFSSRPSQAARLVPDTGQPLTHHLPHHAHSSTSDSHQSQQTHISYSHKQSARLAPVIGPKNQRHLTAPSLPISYSQQHSARLVPDIGRPSIHPQTQSARSHTPDTSQSHQPHISFSPNQSARLAPRYRANTSATTHRHTPSPPHPSSYAPRHYFASAPSTTRPRYRTYSTPSRPPHPPGPLSQPTTSSPTQPHPRASPFPRWHGPNTHRAPHRRNPATHGNAEQATPRTRPTVQSDSPEEEEEENAKASPKCPTPATPTSRRSLARGNFPLPGHIYGPQPIPTAPYRSAASRLPQHRLPLRPDQAPIRLLAYGARQDRHRDVGRRPFYGCKRPIPFIARTPNPRTGCNRQVLIWPPWARRNRPTSQAFNPQCSRWWANHVM